MIVQAIGLLDDLDKELNTYAMRVREWYGWHFPEMTRIVTDNVTYARAVCPMQPHASTVNASTVNAREGKYSLRKHSHTEKCLYCSQIGSLHNTFRPLWKHCYQGMDGLCSRACSLKGT